MQLLTSQFLINAENLTVIFDKLKEIYGVSDNEKAQQVKVAVKRYGYLPFPHIMALEELTPAETLAGIEEKFILNGIYDGKKFNFESNNLSPVKRAGYQNADWVKRDQHNIKLINLAALGDGNNTDEPAKFIDFLKQLLILPAGSKEDGILSTTMYIIPFHPREFGCAYLPTSTEVSSALEDSLIKDTTGLNAKQQVQLFLAFCQLAGHPIMYDVLPQTGRFAKPVLANPHVARWFDIPQLIKSLKAKIDDISSDNEASNIIKSHLDGNYIEVPESLKETVKELEGKLDDCRKELSEEMLKRTNQLKLHDRARSIINTIQGEDTKKQLNEEGITKQGDIIQELIKQGLWPSPGGAWNSAGIPIFNKMSEGAGYPTFRHFDFEGNDVTHFANLDCQTPYYFVNLETGEYNQEVIDFYVNQLKTIQNDYNFDGFRVDHIDHIVDKVSEDEGRPISYRAPRKVLGKANTELKKAVPHFAALAEYMLWDNFLHEYHNDMNFDILWGSDIVSQSQKTPAGIIKDLEELKEYNEELKSNISNLSILKTYNNQDGEFREIDQYPGQLGEDGALFKWFKQKFLPMGEKAQRPVLYIDGDETFTKTGVEHVIGNEVSLKREKNYNFYAKFDAISRLALNNEFAKYGTSSLIQEDEDGFVAWSIKTDKNSSELLLVAANQQAPTEKFRDFDDDGNLKENIKGGVPVFNKKLELPKNYKIDTEIKYNKDISDFEELSVNCSDDKISFEKLKPSQFKIYKLSKQ